MTDEATLSPAQKAWVTRRNGASGPKGTYANIVAKRPEGVTVELTVKPVRGSLTVAFAIYTKSGKPEEIPAEEVPLLSIGLLATISKADGAFVPAGYDRLVLFRQSPDSAVIEAHLPVMKQLEAFIKLATEESEDGSLAQVISSLASHIRVHMVHFGTGDKSKSVKRGAAYITAYKWLDEYLASYVPNKT
jgi:hypothetical protein